MDPAPGAGLIVIGRLQLAAACALGRAPSLWVCGVGRGGGWADRKRVRGQGRAGDAPVVRTSEVVAAREPCAVFVQLMHTVVDLESAVSEFVAMSASGVP